MGWIVLALTFLGGIGTFAFERLADSEQVSSRKAKYKYVANGFTLMVLAGSAIGIYDQIQAGKANETKLKGSIELAKKNTQLAEQLAAANKELRLVLTGGDSVCYLKFTNNIHKDPQAIYAVDGEYDIPQVVFNYYRIPNVLEYVGMTDEQRKVEAAKLLQRVGPIGPLPINSNFYMEHFQYPTGGSANYSIGIFHGRTQIVQMASIKQLDDKSYRYAYRVYRVVGSDGNQTIIEPIPHLDYTDDELKNAEGHVPWLEDPELWKTHVLKK